MKECSHCEFPLDPLWYYCPNCGKQFRQKPIGWFKIAWIMFVSILLPPLGVIYGFRYLPQHDKKMRIVGVIAIMVTLLSLTLVTLYTIHLAHTFTQSLNNQLNSYGG